MKKTLLLAMAASLLGACSTPPTKPNAAPLPANALPSSGAVSAPNPSGLPTFAQVAKGATRFDGPLVIWRKDDKVWLELRPQDFDDVFYFSPKLASGIGESWIYGGLMRQGSMGGPKLVTFRRIQHIVQMIAPNPAFVADPGLPVAQSVRSAFAQSLVGAMNIVSQPDPRQGSVLVDAQGFFLSDLVGLGQQLQQTYRQGYSMDVRNSSITRVRKTKGLTAVEVLAHFVSPGVSSSGNLPSTVPDPRSLFVNLSYSFTRLPSVPMHARLADARLGHFTTDVIDFSNDLVRSPVQHFVNRWRLEKKDPTAALSEPIQPITFWLDRGIPAPYRDAVRSGILAWNLAFERIGFKEAIVVKQQTDQDDFDTLDADRASVRWMTNASTKFSGISPMNVDPRSGEILDVDIALESLATRNKRFQWLQSGQQKSANDAESSISSPILNWCSFADNGWQQLSYGLDVLSSEPSLEPQPYSPSQAFVLAYLKDLVMHETGHALGLRHNFRGSAWRSAEQLADPKLLQGQPLSGSVMDYPAVNLSLPGQPSVPPFNMTLGPYDYWAIEYAYKTMPAAQEAVMLAQIAGRSGERELGFATDEDSYLGIDPQAQMHDLGSDAVEFARRRLLIAQDLLRRQEKKVLTLSSSDDVSMLRHAVVYALIDVGQATMAAARQIGGIYTWRDHPGAGRDPLQPVPVQQQRAALAIVTQVLRGEGLTLSPALQRHLAVDYFERLDAFEAGVSSVTDFSSAQFLLNEQQKLLNQLYSEGVSTRLLNSREKTPSTQDTLSPAALFTALNDALWAGPSNTSRRELQRVQVNLITARLLQPSAYSRAAARAQLRVAAQNLLQKVRHLKTTKSAGPGTSAGKEELAAQAAHWADVEASLTQALSAGILKTGL